MTIVNPLYPAHKRLRLYSIIAMLACLVFYLEEYYSIEGSIFAAFRVGLKYDFKTYVEENKDLWRDALILPMLLQISLGLWACTVAYQSLSKQGIGQAIRDRVVKRQALFVVVTFLSSFPYVVAQVAASSYGHFYGKELSIK